MKLPNEEFQRYLEERIDDIRYTLESKAGEYAKGNDRMYNFNAGLQAEPHIFKTREDVIKAYMTKQLVSVQDILQTMREGSLPTLDFVIEKFRDVINYYILMEASIKQQISESNKLAKSTEATDDLPF